MALGSSLSVDEKDARVMLRVPICGATEPDPALSKNFPEELDSRVEDLPKSLRQDDPLLLLDKILKLDIRESLDEKCLKDLCTSGMQPTMIPIEISANLKTC